MAQGLLDESDRRRRIPRSQRGTARIKLPKVSLTIFRTAGAFHTIHMLGGSRDGPAHSQPLYRRLSAGERPR